MSIALLIRLVTDNLASVVDSKQLRPNDARQSIAVRDAVLIGETEDGRYRDAVRAGDGCKVIIADHLAIVVAPVCLREGGAWIIERREDTAAEEERLLVRGRAGGAWRGNIRRPPGSHC